MIAAIAFAAGLVTGVGVSYVVANIAIKRFFGELQAVYAALGVSDEPEPPRLRVVGGDS